MPMKSVHLALLIWSLVVPSQIHARVFLARQEALQAAFPGSDRLEPQDLFLTEDQLSRIEAKCGTRPPSALVTVYRGYQQDRLLGCAVFDTHTVRTRPETFLIVFDPQGAVANLLLCAFYEPPEYAPPDNWLKQFAGKRNMPETVVGRTVAGITGSTLTAHAVSASTRRAMAIYQTCISDAPPRSE